MTPPGTWTQEQHPQMIHVQPHQIPISQQSSEYPPPLTHAQPQPIVHGNQHYQMSAGWAPQGMVHVPQWSEPPVSVGHTISIDNSGQTSVSNACMVSSTQQTQQSHYQYSTQPSYWVNPGSIDDHLQPMCPTNNTGSISAGMHEPDANIIDRSYTINQPTTSNTIHPTTLHNVPVVTDHPPTQSQAQLTSQYDEIERPIMRPSCQGGQVSDCNPPATHTAEEDGFELNQNGADNFGQPNSSFSDDDDDDDDEDDQPRRRRGNDREKERRQANNARER